MPLLLLVLLMALGVEGKGGGGGGGEDACMGEEVYLCHVSKDILPTGWCEHGVNYNSAEGKNAEDGDYLCDCPCDTSCCMMGSDNPCDGGPPDGSCQLWCNEECPLSVMVLIIIVVAGSLFCGLFGCAAYKNCPCSPGKVDYSKNEGKGGGVTVIQS